MTNERLPKPGQDGGTWGEILNDFLSVEHNSDGTLRTSGTIADKADNDDVVHLSGTETITGAKTFLAPLAVPAPSLGSHAATKTYVDSVAVSGAPDATSGAKGLIQLTGDLGGTATSPTVPALASKMDASVAASTLAPKANPTFTGTVTVPTPANGTDATTKSYVDSLTADATTTSKGKVQLAGDLGGTAAAPTVPALANKIDSATAASTYAPKASPTFSGSVTVPTPASPTDATTKAYVDAQVSSGTADATTTSKGKVQLAGDLAGTAAAPVVAKVNGTAVTGTPATGQVLTATSSSAAAWSTPTATDNTKLAIASNLSDLASPSTARTNLGLGTAAVISATAGGDLSGTLPSPTVAKVNGVAVSGTPSTGQVLTATGATAAAWSAPTATDSTKLAISNNLSDLASVSTARTNLGLGTAALISATAGGDLSGTLPNPTVAKVNGVAVTGTPSAGQVITATSGTAAAWSTPSGGTIPDGSIVKAKLETSVQTTLTKADAAPVILVLSPTDPVPGGTPVGSIILRTT